MNHKCPVCGYAKLKEVPRTRAGGGSYEICPSCGFEFGVSDDDQGFTYQQWREKWQAEGMKWAGHQTTPKDWDPVAQLKTIPRSEKN